MSERRISIAEPVTELRRVKIRECGEPLVDFLRMCPDLRLDRPRFKYRRETYLRQTAAERLCRANELLLRKDLRIQIIEGWRPPFIQERMYRAIWRQFQTRNPDWSEHRLKRVVNQFSAPNNPRVPPPHTTGGAMDLALCTLDGTALDMQTPYAPQDPASFPFAAPGLASEARRNRETLAEALVEAGITNYPSEFWHWSYGDQGWAYRGGEEVALYGAIEPPGWQPHAADVKDAPLEFVFDHPAA
jgi:D-alanyl-D-alanine dipeptidase